MKNKIVLGMSGGVDSSVAAYLLKNQNFDVVGVTLVLNDASYDPRAEYIANKLGIRHFYIDKRVEFCEKIIGNFKSIYESGQTPNPCVLCNRVIKFEQLFHEADLLGAEFVATGHYARIDAEANKLLRAAHKAKDQSYFLYNLKKKWLGRIKFPLGAFEKEDVRAIARETNLGFDGVSESMDVCFFSGDYRDALGVKDKPGDILDDNGTVIGQHGGIHKYTIGQRRGIGISATTPLYVSEISAESNTITLSPLEKLKVKQIRISGVNLLADVSSNLNNVEVKLRHAGEMTNANVIFSSDFSSAVIQFANGGFAPAPGQSCVIYDGDIVLGGGIIENG